MKRSHDLSTSSSDSPTRPFKRQELEQPASPQSTVPLNPSESSDSPPDSPPEGASHQQEPDFTVVPLSDTYPIWVHRGTGTRGAPCWGVMRWVKDAPWGELRLGSFRVEGWEGSPEVKYDFDSEGNAAAGDHDNTAETEGEQVYYVEEGDVEDDEEEEGQDKVGQDADEAEYWYHFFGEGYNNEHKEVDEEADLVARVHGYCQAGGDQDHDQEPDQVEKHGKECGQCHLCMIQRHHDELGEVNEEAETQEDAGQQDNDEGFEEEGEEEEHEDEGEGEQGDKEEVEEEEEEDGEEEGEEEVEQEEEEEEEEEQEGDGDEEDDTCPTSAQEKCSEEDTMENAEDQKEIVENDDGSEIPCVGVLRRWYIYTASP